MHLWRLLAASTVLASMYHILPGLRASDVSRIVSINVNPGDDVQSIVSANPAGTRFHLKSGVYHLQSIAPKDFDSFEGEDGTVLDGAKRLTFAPATLFPHVWVAAAPPLFPPTGKCVANRSLCGDDEDLFIDGKLQVPIADVKQMGPGQWYLDRKAQIVALPQNPTGHEVEISCSPYAFYGSARAVEIRHLTVERYASAAQTAALGGDNWTHKVGAGWIIDNVVVQWNHGAGVYLGDRGRLTTSHIVHNGQLGVRIIGTHGALIENEIAWNDYAGYATNWEAGGVKAWSTRGVLLQSNIVHDNTGNGMWMDYDNANTQVLGNIIDNNTGIGILEEISHDAIISGNHVALNGVSDSTWLWGAQIAVINSSHTEIDHNTVIVGSNGGNGIAIINQNRSNAGETWPTLNNRIERNSITCLGPSGASGLVDDGKGIAPYDNLFDYNVYHLLAGGSMHWIWSIRMTWTMFHIAGQERNGACCT